MALKALKADDNEVVGNDSKTNKIIINLFKNLIYMPNIKIMKELIFLILNIKKASNYLKQAFIKTLILQYFELENHIQIEFNELNYTIKRILSQLNPNSNIQLNDLHLNKSNFDL